MSQSPALLDVDRLTRRHATPQGTVHAVDDVSFQLRPGEVLAVVGPNGSGKTTALRLLAGTFAPDAGTVAIDGVEVPSGQRARALAGVLRTLQGTAVFPTRTALENVLVGAGLRSAHGSVLRTIVATPKAREDARSERAGALAALAEVGILERAEHPAAELAASDQRLLAVAAALAARPRILLLDEPSAGASPSDLDNIERLLFRLRALGIALVLVEHNLRLVRRVADHVVVLDAGQPIAVGKPDDIMRDPAVRAAYLGRLHAVD